MDVNQAQHQSLSSIVVGDYPVDALEDWLRTKGYSLQSVTEGEKPNTNNDADNSQVKKIITRVDRHQVNQAVGDNPDPPHLSPQPIQPKCTTLKSHTRIVLPNGQVLPPGTIQKIVHPYPRPDLGSMGTSFDFH